MEGPLPRWVTITVVLTLLGLLTYSVVVIGLEGLPLSYALIGALGVYQGANSFLKTKQQVEKNDKEPGEKP